MRMRLEVQLSTPSIGYVGIELGRGEIGVSEHLLNRSKIGSTLEQMRGERMAEEVGVDTLRLQPGLRSEPAENEKGPGTRQASAFCVQEQLRPVAGVQERPPPRQVTPKCLGRL